MPRGATASSFKLSVVDPVDHDGLNKDVLNKTFVVSIELIKERERVKTEKDVNRIIAEAMCTIPSSW